MTVRLKPDTTCGPYHVQTYVASAFRRTYSRYASAKPICATNIMRYMCAHET